MLTQLSIFYHLIFDISGDTQLALQSCNLGEITSAFRGGCQNEIFSTKGQCYAAFKAFNVFKGTICQSISTGGETRK